MSYTKITHGWVEQVYDDEGQCLQQEFVPDGRASEYRDVETDDPIEDEVILKQIESKERFAGFEMTQPE